MQLRLHTTSDSAHECHSQVAASDRQLLHVADSLQAALAFRKECSASIQCAQAVTPHCMQYLSAKSCSQPAIGPEHNGYITLMSRVVCCAICSDEFLSSSLWLFWKHSSEQNKFAFGSSSSGWHARHMMNAVDAQLKHSCASSSVS